MSEHNYGADDYETYSQDPEWQELHEKVYPEYHRDSEPVNETLDEYENNNDVPEENGENSENIGDSSREAYEDLSEYMNEHNYGADDYETYSQDPEWQELHEKVYPEYDKNVTSQGLDCAKEFTDDNTRISASDIDMSDAMGMDNPNFWNHHSNTKENYMDLASKLPEVQNRLENGEKLEDIYNDPKIGATANQYYNPDNMVCVEARPDGTYGFIDDGRHRIMAARELGYDIPVRVQETDNSYNKSDFQSDTGSVEEDTNDKMGVASSMAAGMIASKYLDTALDANAAGYQTAKGYIVGEGLKGLVGYGLEEYMNIPDGVTDGIKSSMDWATHGYDNKYAAKHPEEIIDFKPSPVSQEQIDRNTLVVEDVPLSTFDYNKFRRKY